MKRSGDSTHVCRSPTPTVDGRDLTLPTRTQRLSRNIVTWRPVTGGRQHRAHATLPKAFHKEPGRMLSRGRQSM